MENTELKDLKRVEQKTDLNSAQNENQPNLSIMGRIRLMISFLTVEPFLICYILPNAMSYLAVQKLNLEKACQADLNYTEIICHNVATNEFNENDTLTSNASDLSQILVAEMTAWQSPLQSAIPAILILFVGAWSDRTGNRKLLMLMPLFGQIISSIGMLLTTYYFLEWPLWATAVIEAVPYAICGGFSIALMGSYSYVADVTTLDSRTFRMGAVAVIATLGIPLGTAISGVLTEAVGYYGIFTIGLVLYILGFIHTYFRIHDVRKNESADKFTILGFFHPRNVMDTFSILVRNKGDGKKLLKIWLIIFAHIVIVGPVIGESGVQFLYLLSQYSMALVEISLFSTYTVLLGIVGTLIAVTIFSKMLKMHDALIGIIATASKVLSSFVYALAPTKAWIYCAPVVDIFGNVGVTAIRSLGTKVVDASEVGKMCSIIGLAEAIVPVGYSPLYSLVYSNTVTTFPGTFYIIGGVMTIPAFFIFIFIFIIEKRQDRDVVKDPQSKERYAKDNEITSF